MNRHIETFRTDWNGIAIEIRYEPHWLGMDIGFDTAPRNREHRAGAHPAADHRNRLPLAFHIAGHRCRLRRPRRLRRSMARNRKPDSRLAA